MAVELLDLGVAHVPEVGGRDVELGPVGWITPAGVSNGPRKVPWIDTSITTTPPGTLTRCSSQWYARRTSASVSVVIVISHLGIG
jgi:hypothetical protein